MEIGTFRGRSLLTWRTWRTLVEGRAPQRRNELFKASQLGVKPNPTMLWVVRFCEHHAITAAAAKVFSPTSSSKLDHHELPEKNSSSQIGLLKTNWKWGAEKHDHQSVMLFYNLMNVKPTAVKGLTYVFDQSRLCCTDISFHHFPGLGTSVISGSSLLSLMYGSNNNAQDFFFFHLHHHDR